jgi:hypothetical protein
MSDIKVPKVGSDAYVAGRVLGKMFAQFLDAQLAGTHTTNDEIVVALTYLLSSFVFGNDYSPLEVFERLSQLLQLLAREREANQAVVNANAAVVQHFFDNDKVPNV